MRHRSPRPSEFGHPRQNSWLRPAGCLSHRAFLLSVCLSVTLVCCIEKTNHCITLETIYSGLSKKTQGNYRASQRTKYKIMSGYRCRNKRAFSFRRNVSKDVADVTSSGRLFQILRLAVANERSPIVAGLDGLPSRRPWWSTGNERPLAGISATYSRVVEKDSEVPYRGRAR